MTKSIINTNINKHIIQNLLNIDNIHNYNFVYPPEISLYKDTDLEIRFICHSQSLQSQDKFPDFDINELAFKNTITLLTFKRQVK